MYLRRSLIKSTLSLERRLKIREIRKKNKKRKGMNEKICKKNHKKMKKWYIGTLNIRSNLKDSNTSIETHLL